MGFLGLGFFLFPCFFEGRKACLQKFCSCFIFTHILDLIENWHKFSSKGKNVFIKKKLDCYSSLKMHLYLDVENVDIYFPIPGKKM